MAEEAQTEPLAITEDGDTSEAPPEKRVVSSLSGREEPALKKEEGQACKDKNEENPEGKECLLQLQAAAEEDLRGEQAGSKEDKAETAGTINGGPNREGGGSEEEPITVRMRRQEERDKVEDTGKDSTAANGQDSSEGAETQQEQDQPKVLHFSPDFPESLYELLCTLQEGRRFNDQRCSFSLESKPQRRRCHSEPNTSRPTSRVRFSSVTSLQTEELFELVATAQARRLDDQRALLGRSPPPKAKSRSLRGSIKQLSFVRRAPVPAAVPSPVPVPKEDLYNMILSTQAQGRLEDQRSRAPGPMDDEDFFSLLLRVQGGRMEEQRTELPCMLQT